MCSQRRAFAAVTALSESGVLERPNRREAPLPLEKVAQATMQYQVQFLDGLDNVLCEVQADTRSAGTAFLREASIAWPPHATRVRVLSKEARQVGPSPIGRTGAGSRAS